MKINLHGKGVENRAYSVFTAKAVEENDDYVTVSGMATTPAPDRTMDRVDPMGAKFKTPMPLLWQHDHEKPIGNITFAKAGKDGIPFEAQIPRVKEEGALKTRVDEAIQSLKYKLINAVSIGFRVLEDGYEVNDLGGFDIKSWEWLELSLVTIPANSEAMISAVKSVDLSDSRSVALDKAPTEEKTVEAPGGTGRRKPILLIPRGKHS